MISGFYPKSPPPSPPSACIVLVTAAISKSPDVSNKNPSPSPYSEGVVLIPAALTTTPSLSQNPHHPALIIQVFTVSTIDTYSKF